MEDRTRADGSGQRILLHRIRDCFTIFKSMQKIAQTITQASWFQMTIMVVIFVASVMVGLETVPSIHTPYTDLFLLLDYLIQTIFTLEICLRIMAFGSKPLNFFRSEWNIFDFVVTASMYLPFAGPYASVLRLMRVLRVFRLVTALPKLQMLVGALIKSIPSIGYVALLMFVLFYIYAVVGFFQFGATDGSHFGTLGRAMMTLFQVITLEGWVEIYQAQQHVAVATVYFMSFILIGTMIVLNLFIGVVMNGFEEVKKEIEESSEGEIVSIESDLKAIAKQVDMLKSSIDRLSARKH